MPKPSFGCMACRVRRIKCDERTGGCVKCERRRIVCPGYRDRFDVISRHTTAAKGSHQAPGSHPRLESHVPVYQSPLSVGEPVNAVAPWPYIVHQPSADPELAILGAYYSSYCVYRSTVCSLDHVRQQGNGCLWAAIKMLGMLQMNQFWQLSGGSLALTHQYNTATTHLNSALACPMYAQEDSTMLATLLLSIVEMKKSPDFNLRYWLVHTKGAAALMELRGASQVSSRLGAAMFLQFSSQLMVYCILGKRHIPRRLRELRTMTHPMLVRETHPLWRWQGSMFRFVDFYATSSVIQPNLTPKHAQAIISEAMSIHQEFEAVFRDAGSYWEFDTLPVEDLAPFVDHKHIYHSLLAARVWNDRRSATILLFTAVARLGTQLHVTGQRGSAFEHEVQYALEKIKSTSLEILASAPQTLAGLKGKVNAADAFGSAPSTAEGLKLCESPSEYDERVFLLTREDTVILPYMDSCRIQWPIYFAVQCEYVEPMIRSCLFQLLESARKSMQIQQWHILADSLRPGLQMEGQQGT